MSEHDEDYTAAAQQTLLEALEEQEATIAGLKAEIARLERMVEALLLAVTEQVDSEDYGCPPGMCGTAPHCQDGGVDDSCSKGRQVECWRKWAEGKAKA